MIEDTYRIEVRTQEWGGALASGWRPAIAGTLNGTDLSDEDASSGLTLGEADDLWRLVLAEGPARARVVNERTGAIEREAQP